MRYIVELNFSYTPTFNEILICRWTKNWIKTKAVWYFQRNFTCASHGCRRCLFSFSGSHFSISAQSSLGLLSETGWFFFDGSLVSCWEKVLVAWFIFSPALAVYLLLTARSRGRPNPHPSTAVPDNGHGSFLLSLFFNTLGLQAFSRTFVICRNTTIKTRAVKIFVKEFNCNYLDILDILVIKHMPPPF